MEENKNGIVYFIGAGPGDPGLLTIKGKRVLEKCDVIIYDRLVNEKILDLVNDSAEKIYVGKIPGKHTVTQEEINRLIVKYAKKGKKIVRLKGGDPFVFGRGGEEAQVLAREGIPFEIIPGVTSSVAIPAYAGIPVTHRNYSYSFRVITGHRKRDGRNGNLFNEAEWNVLSGEETLIFLMGVQNIEKIVNELIKYGKEADTSIAVIQKGATPEQRVVIGKLGNIYDKVIKENIESPSVIVIGNVVNLRKELRWYENLPLFSRRIVITRSMNQASILSEKLYRFGADTIELPVIEIDYDSCRLNIKKIIEEDPCRYDWIIFTSVNGVKAFFKEYMSVKGDIRELKGIMFGAIGKVTAKEIEKYGILVDYVPHRYVAEEFIKGFISRYKVKDKNILLIRSDKARDIIESKLSKKGANVNSVTGYKNVIPEGISKKIKDIFSRKVDWLTFTSSSTVENFFNYYKKYISRRVDFKIASIGPITTKRVLDFGFDVDVEAEKYTIDGLVNSIIRAERR